MGEIDRNDKTAMECLIEAQEILENAKKEDFEYVFVFGLSGDVIHIRQSSGLSRLAAMGALFAALMECWGQVQNLE